MLNILKRLWIFALLPFISSHNGPNFDEQRMYFPDELPEYRQPFQKGLETFGKNLFLEFEKTNPGKNVFFSPLSIHTCLAMARMGAEGQTAVEMDQVLASSSQNRQELGDNFHTLLAPYQNSSNLKIANKMYVMRGYAVEKTFKKSLEQQFFAAIGALNFANSNRAAKTINKWVSSKTNNKIKNIISPDLLDASTRLVLVNTIYFKGSWEIPFLPEDTTEMDFYLDETNTVKVQMMQMTTDHRFGYLEELKSSVLELAYDQSDLSMVIILPDSRTGLADLEEQLKSYTLAEIGQKIDYEDVHVYLPKFKAEFEVELTPTLEKLGMRRIFSNNAEFSKMLRPSEGLQVSSIVHKAFIEVDENGTEAGASTGMAAADRMPPPSFRADHPFLYFIKDSRNTTIFSGSVKNF